MRLLQLLVLMLSISTNLAFAHDPALHTKPAHASAQQPNRLPLGDGKISATPRQGYVMACRSNFPGGGGAHRVGEWIDKTAGTWDPSAKPQVEGSVSWPNAAITVVREGEQRVVRANNLPTHPTGQYPIRSGSKAYEYDRNPNSIRERTVLLTLPAEPQVTAQPNCVPLGMIGFALSGVAIFNAFDVQGRDAPAYEIQDLCNGHPERNGSYHYHDWSPCLAKDAAGKPYAHDEPVGWMLDGHPILGPIMSDGGEDTKLITNADLDECHGRVGNVRVDGQIKRIYHYRFTMEYPYTIGCFKGQAQRAN
ncbi:YHYH protein [Variovorax sp. PCZ-1]|uniref:YHYH protein n=1 Tax=Variovorax sp. PCZ-1 TaxID=2835533 RepID=UPI001BCA994A|nr:YHYH protein [Variovorax sp. PCZ-1]MBS7807357.1 YHYH protein [Variovorax sp. PCZ-1]